MVPSPIKRYIILFVLSCSFRTFALRADAFSCTMTTWTRPSSCISTGLSSLPMADRTRYGTFTAALWTLNRWRFFNCHILPPFFLLTSCLNLSMSIRPVNILSSFGPLANHWPLSNSGTTLCLFMNGDHQAMLSFKKFSTSSARTVLTWRSLISRSGLLCFRHQLMEEARFPLVEPLGMVRVGQVIQMII